MFTLDMERVRGLVAIVSLLLAILLIARRLEKTFPLESNQPKREVWLDYKLVTVSVLIPYLLSTITAISAGTILSYSGGGFFHLRADGWWLALSVSIYVFVGDVYRYWMHRLSHIIPFLWKLHSFQP